MGTRDAMAGAKAAAAVTRDEIHAGRARWSPGGRGRPRPRLEAQPEASASLRLVRGGGREAARDWSPREYGWPSVIGRLRVADQARPLEVRVWTARPPSGVVDAVFHPSGVWVCIRLLD